MKPGEEHELQPPSGDGHRESRDVPGGEGAKQIELEHRLGGLDLDRCEQGQPYQPYVDPR